MISLIVDKKKNMLQTAKYTFYNVLVSFMRFISDNLALEKVEFSHPGIVFNTPWPLMASYSQKQLAPLPRVPSKAIYLYGLYLGSPACGYRQRTWDTRSLWW